MFFTLFVTEVDEAKKKWPELNVIQCRQTKHKQSMMLNEMKREMKHHESVQRICMMYVHLYIVNWPFPLELFRTNVNKQMINYKQINK